MKSIAIKRTVRAGIAAFLTIILAAIALVGERPGRSLNGPACVLDDDMVRGLPQKTKLCVLVPAGMLYAPAIVSNGGIGIRDGNLFKKNHALSVDLRLVEDPDVRTGLLASGEADLIWMSVDSFARTYPLVRSINPVAIMLAGHSRGGDLVLTRTPPDVPLNYRGARIACSAHSPHHFMMLYLLSLAGVEPDEAKWIFTHTPAEAAALYARGRADICAAGRNDLLPLLDETDKNTILLSTEDAPMLVSGIFVARESTVALRSDQLRAFVKGWFDGLTEIAKNIDSSADLIVRELKMNRDSVLDELERRSFAAYAENLSFFAMDGSSWNGFSQLFDTAYKLYNGKSQESAPLSGFARNTGILVPLQAELGRFSLPQKARGISPSWNERPLPGMRSFYFPENGALMDFESRETLARFARDAHVFSGCAIALYGYESPGEDRWRNLASQRSREAARLLMSDHRIPHTRLIQPNGSSPYDSPRPEITARVDAYLIAPRRDR